MEGTSGSSGPVEISVLVPVLNEEFYIRDAVARMCAQDFEGGFELIFLDGRSTDRTREILEELAREDPRIRVFDNPARRTPQALNLGLARARGRLIARMDAHTYYPPNYLAAGARRLALGGADWVSGPQLAEGIDKWSTRVALALTSPLGVGGAGFRRRMKEEVEVDSGFTGMWRREVLDSYGGWDERWPVDQDFELAARMRMDGRRIVCIPEMAAAYIPRNSIRRLAKQYWTYGFYRAKTSRAHPQSMRRSHVLAPGLALTVLSSAATPKPIRQLARLGIGIYLLALLYSSFAVATPENRRDAATLPLVFSCMHLAAGFGFLAGCMRFGPPLAAIAGLRP
jgi:glycosyltransferase involved in cell wall biosynthesis